MSDTIVVTGQYTPFNMDISAGLFLRGFDLYGLSWVSINASFRTIAVAIAQNPNISPEFEKTNVSPKTKLIQPMRLLNQRRK